MYLHCMVNASSTPKSPNSSDPTEGLSPFIAWKNITVTDLGEVWASPWDFGTYCTGEQQNMNCDVISNNVTSVDSDEPVQPPFNVRNSKWRSISSFTVIKYSGH